MQCWKVTSQWTIKQNYAFVFFLEKKGKLKIRVRDRTHKSFEESGSWCWGSSTEGLENNQGLGFCTKVQE